MTTHDDHRRGTRRPRRPSRLVLATLVLAGALGAACSGGAGIDVGTTRPDEPPNTVPPPTLAGGVELPAVELSRVLVGEGLVYGSPLPGEQAAAELFTNSVEVAAALARRIYAPDGTRLGDLLVLTLDGSEVFDQTVLDAFVRAVVEGLGGGDEVDGDLAGRPVFRSVGERTAAVGFLEGDQLVVVRGTDGAAVDRVAEPLLVAVAAGEVGSTDPATPLKPLPIDAAFVPVPTVEFQPIPPPEEEPAPEPPTFPGATAVEGHYGVVAGERRTTVWAFTVDPSTYPTAEALTPALTTLVSARAGGAPTETIELVDRLVHRATGTGELNAAATFRQEGLVLLVEGADGAQVDAVVSAWIAALGS